MDSGHVIRSNFHKLRTSRQLEHNPTIAVDDLSKSIRYRYNLSSYIVILNTYSNIRYVYLSIGLLNID